MKDIKCTKEYVFAVFNNGSNCDMWDWLIIKPENKDYIADAILECAEHCTELMMTVTELTLPDEVWDAISSISEYENKEGWYSLQDLFSSDMDDDPYYTLVDQSEDGDITEAEAQDFAKCVIKHKQF